MKRRYIKDKLDELELATKLRGQRELSREEYGLVMYLCGLWQKQWGYIERVTPEELEKGAEILIERQEAIDFLERVFEDMRNGDMRSYNKLLAEEKGECEDV